MLLVILSIVPDKTNHSHSIFKVNISSVDLKSIKIKFISFDLESIVVKFAIFQFNVCVFPSFLYSTLTFHTQSISANKSNEFFK
jgi:hypothetical protein